MRGLFDEGKVLFLIHVLRILIFDIYCSAYGACARALKALLEKEGFEVYEPKAGELDVLTSKERPSIAEIKEKYDLFLNGGGSKIFRKSYDRQRNAVSR